MSRRPNPSPMNAAPRLRLPLSPNAEAIDVPHSQDAWPQRMSAPPPVMGPKVNAGLGGSLNELTKGSTDASLVQRVR
jgi:hypothetical protein